MDKKLYKQSLIDIISKKTGVPKAKARIALNTIISITKEEITVQRKASIPKVGSFSVKSRTPRWYKDIKSGELKLSSPRQSIVYKPSKTLLNVLNDNQEDGARIKSGRSSVSRPDYISDEIGCRTIISKPNPHQTNDLRINFIPISSLINNTDYPIVLMPSPNSLLKLPREGRSDVRGYKEGDFRQELENANLPISLSVNMHLPIFGRSLPYESDFVLYDEKLNLYIDVEIDEPYDGYSRTPTHVSNASDDIRNRYFNDSGWVVIRFTEHQIHTNPSGCVATIKYIIESLQNQTDGINKVNVTHENKWDVKQAVTWAKDLYREKYLGIQTFQEIIRHQKVICKDKSDPIESVISRPIIHRFPNSGDKTSHKTIQFEEKTHIYYPPKDLSGNSDYISVTTLIEQFFPHFDEEKYIAKRIQETGKTEEEIRQELKEPSDRGTAMHEEIEKCLKGEAFDNSSKELQMFQKFYAECIIPQNLEFYAAEKTILLPEHNIAGTVDALFKKPNGEYVMVDWKRSKHLIIDGFPRQYGFGRGLSVLSHLDNSSYYKYEMQQSFYKYILESQKNMKISSMILAVFHPDYSNYYTIRIRTYREKEVKKIIEIHDRMLK